MDKWSLLFLTVLATVATILSFVWWHQAQDLSTSDIEKIVGYDGSHLPPDKRWELANRQKKGDPLIIVVIFFASLWFVLAGKTVDAFFP